MDLTKEQSDNIWKLRGAVLIFLLFGTAAFNYLSYHFDNLSHGIALDSLGWWYYALTAIALLFNAGNMFFLSAFFDANNPRHQLSRINSLQILGLLILASVIPIFFFDTSMTMVFDLLGRLCLVYFCIDMFKKLQGFKVKAGGKIYAFKTEQEANDFKRKAGIA